MAFMTQNRVATPMQNINFFYKPEVNIKPEDKMSLLGWLCGWINSRFWAVAASESKLEKIQYE